MVLSLKQEQAGESSLEPCEIRCLAKALEADGRPFHERLNDARKRECVSETAVHLTNMVLAAFGPSPNAFGVKAFERAYVPLIRRDVLKGRDFPPFGKRACEKMFIGAMLVLLGPEHVFYDTFKAAWNTKMHNHYVLT